MPKKSLKAGRDWPLDKMTKKHVKKRDEALEAIAHRQKSLAKLYAEVTGQPSWRVEIIDNEGKQIREWVTFCPVWRGRWLCQETRTERHNR